MREAGEERTRVAERLVGCANSCAAVGAEKKTRWGSHWSVSNEVSEGVELSVPRCFNSSKRMKKALVTCARYGRRYSKRCDPSARLGKLWPTDRQCPFVAEGSNR